MKTNRKRVYEWMNPLETVDKAKKCVEADLRDEQGHVYAHGVSTCMIINLNK